MIGTSILGDNRRATIGPFARGFDIKQAILPIVIGDIPFGVALIVKTTGIGIDAIRVVEL